jgi:hypothetical protein
MTVTNRAFKMAYWRWLLPLMYLVGAGPSTAHIAIEGDVLRVKMGWFWFQATIPLRSIVHARPSVNAWFAVGIHTDFMRGWIVNGSPFGMVHLTIEPPASGRFVGLPIQVGNLWLSLEHPDAFVAALTESNHGAV